MTSNAAVRNPLMAVVAVVLASTSLHLGSTIATAAFAQIPPLGVNLFRLCVAAVLLLAITRPNVRAWRRSEWLAVLWLGLSIAGMNSTFYLAIDRLPLGVAVSIEFLGPLLLSAVLSRRARDFIWIGLALIGMSLLAVESFAGIGTLDPMGVVFALGAALFWALYIIAGTNAGAKISGNSGLAVAFGFAMIAAIPLGVVPAANAFTDPILLVSMLGVGVLGSLIPFTLEYYAMRQVTKPVFGILTSLEPAVATGIGFVVLHQAVGPLRLAAVAFVIVASIGIALGARRVLEIDMDPGPGVDTAPITLPIVASHLSANAHETHRIVVERTGSLRVVGGVAGARKRATRADVEQDASRLPSATRQLRRDVVRDIERRRFVDGDHDERMR